MPHCVLGDTRCAPSFSHQYHGDTGSRETFLLHRSGKPQHHHSGKAKSVICFNARSQNAFLLPSLLFVISLSLPHLFTAIRPGRSSTVLSAMISHPKCLRQSFPAARQGRAHTLLPNSFTLFHNLLSSAEKRTAA